MIQKLKCPAGMDKNPHNKLWTITNSADKNCLFWTCKVQYFDEQNLELSVKSENFLVAKWDFVVFLLAFLTFRLLVRWLAEELCHGIMCGEQHQLITALITLKDKIFMWWFLLFFGIQINILSSKVNLYFYSLYL